jgi:hypothetical protein
MFQLDILGNTVKGLLKPVTLGMRELGDRGGGGGSFLLFLLSTAQLICIILYTASSPWEGMGVGGIEQWTR